MPDPDLVYRFDRAMVRRPAKTVVHGLRAVDRGDPDFDGICREHNAYTDALRAAGVDVTVLPPFDACPDAIFVEDPALVFSTGAIVLRARAAARAAEAEALAPTLQEHFDRVLHLPPRGYVDGGDVLVTPASVMIGLSGRTDRAGAGDLLQCLDELGMAGRIVATPKEVLHFKSDCSLLDEQTILATTRLAGSGVFEGFDVVETPAGEEHAANALRVNDHVFVGSHFPRTIELLHGRNFNVVPLAINEIGKIDAGLSCMSLRWRRP